MIQATTHSDRPQCDHHSSVPPITIIFMLTCYFSPDPASQISPRPGEELGERHWNSAAGYTTRKWLQENGLVDQNYRATERGEAWVKFMCTTPLPVNQWILPERCRALPQRLDEKPLGADASPTGGEPA